MLCLAVTFSILIIDGFTQYFLKWYGPFEIFNGLIIWFQREPAYSSVTGLFNNPNYAGLWLTAMWPFSAFTIINQKKNELFNLYSNSHLSWIYLLLTVDDDEFLSSHPRPLL